MTPNWILDENQAKQTKTSYWKTKQNKTKPLSEAYLRLDRGAVGEVLGRERCVSRFGEEPGTQSRGESGSQQEQS